MRLGVQGEPRHMVIDQTLIPIQKAMADVVEACRVGSVLDRRAAIQRFEDENLKLPQVDIPLEHHFVNHMYWRERSIEKGWCITTKIHREAGITVILKGKMVFVTEDGAIRITGPAMFETKPGTKRIIFAEEDSLFSTVHPNIEDSRDPDELEARITAPDFSFLEIEVTP